jgi:regulatory protein
MGRLASREHTELELRRKLGQKEFPAPLIDQLINELKSSNALSDARYAEVYFRMRSRKGYGPVRIQMELSEKGVDDGLISVAEAESEVDWEETILSVWRKRFNTLPEDNKARAKQWQYLSYRGFNAEQIRDLYRLCSEPA